MFGGGVLGGAMKKHFPEAKIYDKYHSADPLAEVKAQDVIFICVPTPYTTGKGFDPTELDDVFSNLADLQDKIVVIRSTVLPGTTAEYQKKYPALKILFNPEFLTEATSEQDFLHPDKQLVGYTPQSRAVAEEVLNLLPGAPYKKVLPSGEAEMVKYMVNCFYAVKVTFANQIYDICVAAGLNYETVKEAFAADKRVVNQHLEIFHKGYRGFGGKCLRKDIYSLIDFAEKLKVDPALLKAAKELNLKFNDNK